MSKLHNWQDNERRIDVLRRTAREVKSYRTAKKVLFSALATVMVLVLIMFIGAAIHRYIGRLTIGVDKADLALYGLTLSETRDMKYCTSRLNADISEKITNISVNDLPDNLDMIDGVHNGSNYIAYTFYLEHRGSEVLDFEYEVALKGVTLGMDEAIRIRLYINGEYTDYAKTRSDGGGAEPGTTEFYSLGIVTQGTVEDYNPGDKTKYTVVIWLEGDDPDCQDRIIDGLAKVEMNFRVVRPTGESEK